MTTPTQPCSVCERETPTAELTPSGRCTDCLPVPGRRPYGAPGPGRQRVRQMLAPYRERKAAEAAAAQAALTVQEPTDVTVPRRPARP